MTWEFVCITIIDGARVTSSHKATAPTWFLAREQAARILGAAPMDLVTVRGVAK